MLMQLTEKKCRTREFTVDYDYASKTLLDYLITCSTALLLPTITQRPEESQLKHTTTTIKPSTLGKFSHTFLNHNHCSSVIGACTLL